MKITRRILKELIKEEVAAVLLEAEFFDSPDEDQPGKKQIITFSAEEKYPDIEGNTHGGLSHTIKHYLEFNPTAVSAALKQALAIAKKSTNFFIKNVKTGQTIADGEEAKKQATDNAMLNTFDLINDKTKNKEQLTDEEKQILPIISKMDKEYQALVDSYISAGIDVESVSDAEKIKQLVDSGKIIKFIGKYKGNPYQYYLNTSNTGLIAQKDGKVATLFRVDKKGKDLSKVAKYFARGVEIQNAALSQVLSSSSPAAAAPTQQKKQKTPQQKKGPNIKAMAVGMSRGGKSLEDIQAQIKKTTGRDISVDNIKRMIA